ncbi:tetratricopeptide repeat protein [Massilia varians]|uniref:tetratricopeptide repeat protein n=1 Tax=Massilia varians TaxID=457921 RepID=UPI00248F9C9E|nr:tetratricopeptide repeat protein [Massilia varians]
MGDLGTAYHRQQKLGQARMHLAAQIALLESLPGTTAETLAAALDYLGEVDSEDGRLDEAEAGFRRALALRMKSTGEMDNGVAESHASLSRLYVSRDQMARAEFHIRKVVAIREQLFGAASSQASHSRAALAQLLYESGKYGEAQPLFEEALALIEEQLGKEHPHILNDLNNLAYNERAQRRHEQALTTFRRVLAVREADFGDRAHHSVASALTGLGAALVEAGQLREAEARLLAGLAMREQLLGPDHVDLAYSMTELGRLYIAQGRHADADKALLRALRIIEAAIGKDHSEVAAVLYEQGRSLQAQGRASEAAASWKRALAIRLRARPGHPATRETVELLSSLYRKAGDARAAEKVEADMAAAAREASASGAAAVPGT